MDVDKKHPKGEDLGLATTTDVVYSDPNLDRNFSLLSISAVGIVTGNTWAALGGSIVSRRLLSP